MRTALNGGSCGAGTTHELALSPFTRLRIARALFQQDIATRLGIQRQTLTKWEHGVSQPSLRYRRQLADILEISLQELLEIFPPRPRRKR